MTSRSLIAALTSAALLVSPAPAAAQSEGGAQPTSPAPSGTAAPAQGTPTEGAPAPAGADAQGSTATAPTADKPAAGATAAEAPPSVPQKVDPAVFDKALQDYFDGNPRDAAGPLYAWLQAAPKTDENYAWAQYFLARSLIDLGLTHAGASYLARIARERSNPNVLPRALDALKSLTDRPHDEVMIDEQVFGALDLGFLPEETGAYAHYQQGLVDLRVGNERWANTHFSKLPEKSAEASRAKFALLVTRLKQIKEPTDEIIADFLALSEDEKLTREARNEAALAVARLRYERKDFQGALEAYDRVKLPPLDPGRASLYLEEAWTRYKLGELRAALGILTTLDAPSFRDEFLPDKYLLRALIYRDLCHYLPAKRAAKELTRRFADSLEAVRNREDLTQDVRLRRAANAHGSTQRAARFLETLELEGERLGRYAGSFGDRLFSHLTKLYDLSRAEAVRVHDARLAEAVRQEADTLLRAAEQVRLMEYEVGLKLYERVKKGARIVAPEDEQILSPTQTAYRFDGEYWNDELRSYRVRIDSRCIEETP
ncbi:tetratricopeptide repeat protein [Myxococcus sp. Y35]|uniref:tetratricopeptide repeat protein n=1 Tax=Pseudomyxococcus flavus TaxID=3115648 RepID=UPI003CEBEC91